jgi:S1-C subfamily serine protease
LLSADDFRRTWKSATGKFSVEASFAGQDGDVVLLKSDSRAPIKVPLKKLSAIDQKFVAGVEIIERDRTQFDLVNPHLERYAESPMAVIEIVEEISKQQPDSPYASMMTGLAYACEMGDYDKANRYFNKAKTTIRDAQKILGDSFHEQTERSIHNNLAISALKARKGNTAVKHLAAGTTESLVPFSIYHNATLLMEVTRGRGSFINFNGDNRKKLVGILARKAPASPAGKVPTRFLYSLKWDEPMSISELDRFVKGGGVALETAVAKGNSVGGAVFSSQKQLTDRGYIEYCSGSGFLITPDLMLTNRHVIQSPENSLSYTITQYQKDGEPRLVGGSIVKWSAIQEEDLALIKLDQPMNAPALPLNFDELQDKQPVTVLGFPETDVRGEHLSAASGAFIRYDTKWPWFYSTNQLAAGNSGGPVVDMNGNVVGIAFAKRDYRKYKLIGDHWLEIRYLKDGVSISNKAVKDFLKVAAPDLVLPAVNQKPFSSGQELVERVRGSTMLIKSWMPPTTAVARSSSSRYRSDVTQLKLVKLATLREKRLYPDLHCMRCSGKGFLDCPNRRCNKGGVARKGTRQTGVNPITGTPIYASNTVYDTCTVCDGKGGAICPDCDRGRLSLLEESR